MITNVRSDENNQSLNIVESGVKHHNQQNQSIVALVPLFKSLHLYKNTMIHKYNHMMKCDVHSQIKISKFFYVKPFIGR
jgi:hypothetical protein